MPAEVETAMYVKQPAWHHLGQVLVEVPNTDEAFAASGLNWSVIKAPLFFRPEGMRRGVQAEQFALVRKSDWTQLGICREQYHVYQNNEAFDWCRPLVESKYWNWEAAGALRNGQICWALLKQNEVEVLPGDRIDQYLLKTWSHTGNTSVSIMPTNIRVVCQNTLTAALRNKQDQHRVAHFTGMVPKMEEVRELYDYAAKELSGMIEDFKVMLDTPMSQDERTAYVDALLPVSEDLTRPSQAIANSVFTKTFVVDGCGSGGDLGVTDTAYGAFNAFSEATEHYLGGNRIIDRGMNILFGQGAVRNKKAYRLALGWREVASRKSKQARENKIQELLVA